VATRTRAPAAGPRSAERGCLLVADLSGYTLYVVSSPLEYAEDVLADVTATVAERLGHVLQVNKLEGDAVFGYALDGESDPSMLLDAVEECYFAFRKRLAGMEHATSCSCNACVKLPELDLKFVLHHGTFVRRSRSGGEELTGEDVILVHRLLKNRVTKALGLRGYALVTEACVNALGLDPAALGMAEHRERFEDAGDVRAFVSDLDARWKEESERRRVFVGRDEAAFEIEAVFAAPPSVVWDHLTAPEKRTLWLACPIDEVTAGGRRCTGTTSVCVDGRATIYEEILDWRPFDYFTEKRSLPRGAELVVTTELMADDGETRVRTRGAKLDGRKRLAWLVGGRRVVLDLRRGYERLAATLEQGG
jgi:hypothetical protein